MDWDIDSLLGSIVPMGCKFGALSTRWEIRFLVYWRSIGYRTLDLSLTGSTFRAIEKEAVID